MLRRTRIMLHCETVRSAMTDLADAHALPGCDKQAMLLKDVAALAGMFSSIMDSRYLRQRLDVIEPNACQKFHIDALTARLICPYRGRATQYGNGAMGEDPKEIYDLPKGSAMILRGTSWANAREPGQPH